MARWLLGADVCRLLERPEPTFVVRCLTLGQVYIEPVYPFVAEEEQYLLSRPPAGFQSIKYQMIGPCFYVLRSLLFYVNYLIDLCGFNTRSETS